MRALNKNLTWDIVELPREKKASSWKWVFAIKNEANGDSERYKAKLVEKGFTQIYGIGYQETSASMAKINYIRV